MAIGFLANADMYRKVFVKYTPWLCVLWLGELSAFSFCP